MGRHRQEDKHSESYWENHPPECSRGLFHIIKHHPLRPLMKRLAHKRDGDRSANAGILDCRESISVGEMLFPSKLRMLDTFISYAGTVPARIPPIVKKKDLNLAETRNSNVEQKVTPFTSVSKNSVKKQIKALIKEISKKGSRHHRSSSCPVLSNSNHDLEQSNVGNTTRTKRHTQCGAKPSGEHHWVRKHQPLRKNFMGQELKDDKQCVVEDKVTTYGRKHNNNNNNHNNDILTFLHEPVSPRIYQFHKQQMYSAKMALTRSASFPLPDSSSERARSEVTNNASLPKRQGNLCFRSKTQKSVQLKSSKIFCEEAMASASEWRVCGNSNTNKAMLVRDVNSSSGSSQCQKKKEIKHVKNLKQKIELVTGENKREKVRVANDAIIHKLPQGHVISDELKREILKKLTEPSCNESSPSASFLPEDRIRRAWSLPEPLESYFQLHGNSFNTEPRSKKLKLRTEKAHSPLRIRILSLPDLQSFSITYQNGEISNILTLTKPIKASGDGTMSSESVTYEQNMLDLNVHSRNQEQLDAPVENLIQEVLVSEGENDLVINNIMGSESDCSSKINDNVSIIVNDFGHSSLRNNGTSNDQDTGAIQEDMAAIAESDSKSNPGPVDNLDSVDQQREANKDSLKVTETTENAQKVEILNYEQIPQLKVDDTRHKDEFNYVKYVLEISGLTGNDCLSAWHSSNHPVDPLLYEEMEDDPEFCGGGGGGGDCNHHVLFDLINESLLEIYGRSYNCCYHDPTTPLSSLPLIHPMPSAGCHIVPKVWAQMSRYLRFKGGQTVDDHVGRDLAKFNELVNLQLYAEGVGLEVEELIFHELMKEIVCDLA